MLIQVNTEYRLDHTSANALKSILSSLAEYGTSIHLCRSFCRHPSKTATLQAFSASLSTQLHIFNTKLAEIQSTYANMKTQTTSLISLQNLLHDDLELFHEIESLLLTSQTSNSLLTNLHGLACQSHAIGSHSLHEFILKLFIPPLETYLRPLHGWMTQGNLNTANYPEFFITSTLHNDVQVYDLVREKSETIAPRFMLHVVNRVLAAGKTMDFVKRMKSLTTTSDDDFLHDRLDYEHNPMNPFEQAFENALDEWIMEKYDFASIALKGILNDSSELWIQLNRVHGIYCMLSHISMSKFTHVLFEKVSSF